MTARSVMRHRCTTLRDHAGPDNWGDQGPSDWEPNLTGVPCYAWLDKAERVIGTDQDVMLVEMRLLMPLGTDVLESDRVAEVTDLHGSTTILDGPLLIDTIGRRLDHLVLLLKQVT
jgi:hypothetical protein